MRGSDNSTIKLYPRTQNEPVCRTEWGTQPPPVVRSTSTTQIPEPEIALSSVPGIPGIVVTLVQHAVDNEDNQAPLMAREGSPQLTSLRKWTAERCGRPRHDYRRRG
jgi:hypothetical protein